MCGILILSKEITSPLLEVYPATLCSLGLKLESGEE
jgi:hypothetical protein